VYHFHFKRCTPGAVLTNQLAAHTFEIHYIFGNLTNDGFYDQKDVEISQLMQAAWLSFARNGVPVSPDGREWPLYSTTNPLTACIENRLEIRRFPANNLIELLNGARLAKN